MGTTLTGTTPQDTYEALIKVGDNGIITGSLKTLSDGEGHDTALALSTGAASVTGTLAVTAGTVLATASGGVGVGFANPTELLTIQERANNAASNFIFLKQQGVEAGFKLGIDSLATGGIFITSRASGVDTEKIFNILKNGNVGIGTSAPATKLTIDNAATATTRAIDIVGNVSTALGRVGVFSDGMYLSSNYFFNSGQNNDTASLGQTLIVMQSAAGSASKIEFATSAAGATSTNVRASIDADGLKFGSDTAAANALDDYEEGTWTPVFEPSTTAGTYTYNLNDGKYTKIGNQVTVQCTFIDVTEVSAGSGDWRIVGLPFNIPNTNINFRLACFLYVRQSAATRNNLIATPIANSNSVELRYDNNAESGGGTFTVAADFANNMDISFTLTYFV